MAQYWFRQKRFGYGATPNTWQGWLFTVVVAVLMCGVVLAAYRIRDPRVHGMALAIGIPLILVPAILVGRAKTEGGWRWRWSEERFDKGERNGPSSAAASCDDHSER